MMVLLLRADDSGVSFAAFGGVGGRGVLCAEDVIAVDRHRVL
jgi:hypothetical protein